MLNFNVELLEIDNAFFNEYLHNNFNLSETALTIFKNKKELLIKEIIETYSNVKRHEIKVKDLLNYTVVLLEKKFCLIIPNIETSEENITNVELYAKDFSLLEEITRIIEKYSPGLNENVTISISEMFLAQNGGISVSNKNLEIQELEWIKKEYYPFLKLPDFVDYYIDKKNKSNLLILLGEYGVGKTKFIDYIIKYAGENFDKFFSNREIKTIYVAYIKDINLLVSSKFWNEAKKYDFLVLDDLEFNLLSPRTVSPEDTSKNSFISNLLSFLDGIIQNNIKVIITSNTEKIDIDKGLLREGRLFGILKFRPLKTKEEVLNLFKVYNINDKKFINKILENIPITQAEIYKKIQNFQNNNNIFSINDLLNDKSVNILQETNNNKIGLI